jgi:hypothetical protein
MLAAFIVALLVFFLIVLPILAGVIIILTGGFAAIAGILHLSNRK